MIFRLPKPGSLYDFMISTLELKRGEQSPLTVCSSNISSISEICSIQVFYWGCVNGAPSYFFSYFFLCPTYSGMIGVGTFDHEAVSAVVMVIIERVILSANSVVPNKIVISDDSTVCLRVGLVTIGGVAIIIDITEGVPVCHHFECMDWLNSV